MAASPVKTRRNHLAGDTSLVGAGVVRIPLVIRFAALDSSSIW